MLKYLILLLLCLCITGCFIFKVHSKNENRVALVRAQSVSFLTINGAPIDSAATAVVIIPGRNELQIRWPANFDGIRHPRDYRLIMSATTGSEYVIAPHPKTGFLCAWVSEKQQINFSKNVGCVANQPT